MRVSAIALLVLLAPACSAEDGGIAGSTGGATHSGGSASGGSGGSAQAGAGGMGGSAPFQCEAVPAQSPTLSGILSFDPAEPHPGDTLTVVVKAQNGMKTADAPQMTLWATGPSGTRSVPSQMVIGGSPIYVFEVPALELGDLCLLGRIGDQAEISGKLSVTARPTEANGTAGVYKVTENHQLTCDEQPDWGNELHVQVLDAQGQGVPNAVVEVRLPDWTDVGSIKNAAEHTVPTTLSMNSSGSYDDYFWWPSNDNGFTIFELRVKGSASDRATEITSGWWGTDPSDCRYCPAHDTRNVYGHWSHRVVFRLDPSAMTACSVGTDHAGQSACGTPGHVQHDPDSQACWTVK